MAQGLSTAEIGRRLVVSPVTVRRHISGILETLGAPDRAAAVRLFRKPARPPDASLGCTDPRCGRADRCGSIGWSRLRAAKTMPAGIRHLGEVAVGRREDADAPL